MWVNRIESRSGDLNVPHPFKHDVLPFGFECVRFEERITRVSRSVTPAAEELLRGLCAAGWQIRELKQSVRGLEVGFQKLDWRVARLECATHRPAGDAGKHAASEKLGAVVAMTKELFPGPVSVDLVSDPEFPQTSTIAFAVTASGDASEIVQRRREWHRQVRSIASNDFNNLRLCISPTE